MKKIFVYGYGNPGRFDDGLGNAFIEKLEKWIQEKGLENIKTDSNYQLNIEDAYEISQYDIVVFVDASEEPIENYIFTEVQPSESHIEFTMHAVSCAFVLDLCQKIYDKTPETYLLHIKGYEWEFAEQLSDNATENLGLAFDFLIPLLQQPEKLKTAVQGKYRTFGQN